MGLPLAPENLLPVFELIIGTPSYQASYVVESSTRVISTGNTSSAEPATVTLQDSSDSDSSLEVLSSGYADRMKGLRVHASGDNPISVLVTMKYPSFSVSGYSSFLLHPNNELDGGSVYEYYAISTDYTGTTILSNRRSNVLLVGNFNATTISIIPTQTVSLPVDAQANSSLVDVAAGTMHNITLNKLQTLLISSLNDLTGTRIISTMPTTVITGHQCGQIPVTHGFCEPLYIQIPPTFNWGQTFLLAPFAGRTTSQEYYKFVTSMNSTTISYRCGNLDSQGVGISTAGSGRFLSFSANMFCYFTATNPIFIVQFGSGFRIDRMGDPVMTIISPTSGYINSTTFVNLPSNVFPSSFIAVTVQAKHFNRSQIHLDRSQLHCNWTAIYNITSEDIVGYGCTANVTAGTHNVSHSGENGVLSVVTYGWSSSPALGYAYLTGFNLEFTEQTEGSYGRPHKYIIVAFTNSSIFFKLVE